MLRRSDTAIQGEQLLELAGEVTVPTTTDAEQHRRDLAAVAAALYALHGQSMHAPVPYRLLSSWHHSSRVPPRWRLGEVLYGEIDHKA